VEVSVTGAVSRGGTVAERARRAGRGGYVASVDVLGMGNAIVDVLAHADDGFLDEHGLVKGSMRLVDGAESDQLYGDMGPGTEMSGGSAANTVVGVVSLGGTAGFVGRVRDDELGRVFTHDIRAAGVDFTCAPAADGPPTGRCLVLVSPDAERTMSTFLGAASHLVSDDVDPSVVAAAAVTYLEGYLWDPDDAKEAFRKAMMVAHDAGRQVALSLSDSFCVDRFRAEFVDLIDSGRIDILFANRAELCSLFEVDDLESGLKHLAGRVPLAAITVGAEGSVIVSGDDVERIDARLLGGVVDTTGAGDLYAAGFLFGLTRGFELRRCGELASLAAAEIISHVGARPERPLAALAAEAGLL
jgi:sugar/nucleoside kinase (ribokinase family)